jgi:mono/diheme cytochrome c family protein
LYLESCAHCHAADARGDEGPDLHGAQVSDRYIARIIRRGIPHEMPSFAKKHGADDTRALIAYVRSLE